MPKLKREKLPLNPQDIVQYVENNIGTFHQKRIEALKTLSLSKVLKKKNPYLYKAKHVLKSQDIVQEITDATISSSEEAIFGDWLEGLAIFINEKVYGGWKSGIGGIDLEFDNDERRYIVTIKSGPNWANSKQTAKMIADFATAQKTLRTSNSKLNVQCVNGCCYGRDSSSDKGTYLKLCGQKFWEFISGDADLYIKIIEPLGHGAKERNDEFQEAYAAIINKFTTEFSLQFCDEKGNIKWEELVIFNSGKDKPKGKVLRKKEGKVVGMEIEENEDEDDDEVTNGDD